MENLVDLMKKSLAGLTRPTIPGIDSKVAQDNIEKSEDSNQIQKWLDLLEPVKFVNINN